MYDGYQALANEIVNFSVREYKHIVRIMTLEKMCAKYEKRDSEWFEHIKKKGEKKIIKIEDFFLSEWFKILTDYQVDGYEVVKELRRFRTEWELDAIAEFEKRGFRIARSIVKNNAVYKGK